MLFQPTLQSIAIETLTKQSQHLDIFIGNRGKSLYTKIIIISFVYKRKKKSKNFGLLRFLKTAKGSLLELRN